MRLLLWLTLFIVTTGIVLRVPVVEVLFGGLSDEVLGWTASTFAWFLLGLPAHAMNVVLTRAFYSAQDTRTPVAVACLSVVVNVVVSLATVDRLGLAGLALGVALGGWFETITLSLLLDRRTSSVPARSIASGGALSLLGALLAGAVALAGLAIATAIVGESPGRLASLAEGAIVGLASLGSYLLYSRIMGIPELTQSLRLARAAFRRGGDV